MQTRSLRSPRGWLVTLVGLASQAPVLAQTLADPTRPPAAWLAAQSRAPGAEMVAEPASPGVQIVVIGPTRRFAMINGQAVHPGESYNGSRLVAINEDGAVWRREGITEKASMNPAVSKKVMGAAPTAGKAKSKKKPVNGEGQ